MSLGQQSPRAWQFLRNKTALWRGLAVVAVLLGVAGLLVSARVMASRADASPVTTDTSVSMSAKAIWNPCTGELVDLTGNMHIVTQATPDGNGGFQLTMHANPQGVTGIGETTGNTYQLNGETSWVGSTTAAGATVMFPDHDNFHLISQGSAPNELIHFNQDVTVNSDGTVTLSFDSFRFECQ